MTSVAISVSSQSSIYALFAASGASGSISGVIDNEGHSFNDLGAFASGDIEVEVWKYDDVSSSSSYTVTASSSVQDARVWVVEVTGANSSASLDMIGPGSSGSNSTVLASVTTQNSDDLVLMITSIVGSVSGMEATGGDTFLDFGGELGTYYSGVFYEPQSGAGSLTLQGSIGGGGPWVAIDVAIKASTTSSTTPPTPVLSVGGYSTGYINDGPGSMTSNVISVSAESSIYALFAAAGPSGSISDVTDSEGHGFALAGQYSSGENEVEVWEFNSVSSSSAYTVSANSAAEDARVWVVEVSGTDTFSALDKLGVGNGGTGSTMSASVSSTANQDLILMTTSIIGSVYGMSATGGDLFLSYGGEVGQYYSGVFYESQTTSGTITLQGSTDGMSTEWVAIAVAIKASATSVPVGSSSPSSSSSSSSTSTLLIVGIGIAVIAAVVVVVLVLRSKKGNHPVRGQRQAPAYGGLQPLNFQNSPNQGYGGQQYQSSQPPGQQPPAPPQM
jgi:hypothetical protein